MPTVLHPTAKNQLINLLTGASTTSNFLALTYMVPSNGAQPADPSAAIGGSSVWASYSLGISTISSYMSAPGGGISQLTAPRSGTAGSATSVSNLTFARFYNNSGNPVCDTPVSLSDGGGGAFLDTLNSSAGVSPILTGLSVKMPLSNGTLKLNAALANQLVGYLVGLTASPAYMGINISGACGLYLYSGSAPADADSAATGTLLATISIGASQIWGSATGGAAALVANPSATASATGTIGYARLVKTFGSLSLVIQGSVGTSSGDFVLNTLSTTGGTTTVTLTDATISI